MLLDFEPRLQTFDRHSSFTLPSGFHIASVDEKLQKGPKSDPRPLTLNEGAQSGKVAPLGVLEHFTGIWVGKGFNTIFRPKNSGSNADAHFDSRTLEFRPAPFDDNILQLNLTTERLEFTGPIGSVPNRGLELPKVKGQQEVKGQTDIFLNGVSYMQTIKDVTNNETGKGDGEATDIHLEPGLWMHIPSTKTPEIGPTLSRMASIPHGTTINAQSDPSGVDFFVAKNTELDAVTGKPKIPKASIAPFGIGSDPKINFGNIFPSLKIQNNNSPRIPQNLDIFNQAGTIDQAILDNPNVVLDRANNGKKFIKTIEFTVSTTPLRGKDDLVPRQDAQGNGIANIAFLEGGASEASTTSTNQRANADASKMTSTFYIATVQHQITVPKWKLGNPTMFISPKGSTPADLVPIFSVTPDRDITQPETITVESTQIQYSQTVLLDFAKLSWPHMSVATLIPSPRFINNTQIPENPIVVPASAFQRVSGSRA